jgi:fimbrial chaperone protein
VNKAKTEDNNVLQLAILSRIKLFVRPNNLAMPPEEALSQLRFERVGNHLKVSNASPYYVTLVNLKLGGKSWKPDDCAEKLGAAGAAGGSWRHAPRQSVNDYGAITPARSVNL